MHLHLLLSLLKLEEWLGGEERPAASWNWPSFLQERRVSTKTQMIFSFLNAHSNKPVQERPYANGVYLDGAIRTVWHWNEELSSLMYHYWLPRNETIRDDEVNNAFSHSSNILYRLLFLWADILFEHVSNHDLDEKKGRWVDRKSAWSSTCIRLHGIEKVLDIGRGMNHRLC